MKKLILISLVNILLINCKSQKNQDFRETEKIKKESQEDLENQIKEENNNHDEDKENQEIENNERED